MTLNDAFLYIICAGVCCGADNCECDRPDVGCVYRTLDGLTLSQIAKRRYEETRKQGKLTPKQIDAMKVIDANYPNFAKVV